MWLIYEKIKQFNNIIIHGHIKPDGDCYGSRFGLKNIIKSTFPEKNVYVVGEKNPSLSFIGELDVISDDLYQNALVFVVDTGAKNLVSDQRFILCKDIVWIDHHIYSSDWKCDGILYSWIDPNFASCSEMIFILKEQLNLKISFEGAVAIYTGILTDSNNFKYERVNSKTFLILAELLKYGVDISAINRKINLESLNFLKYKSYCLKNLIIDSGFCYIKISKEIMENLNLTYNQVFKAVNLLENLEDIYVWALFAEYNHQQIKVSLRSGGPEIYSIAQKFNGGGHFRACGIMLSSEQDYLLLMQEIKKSVQNFINKKTLR